jgi:hypothetical protein
MGRLLPEVIKAVEDATAAHATGSMRYPAPNLGLRLGPEVFSHRLLPGVLATVAATVNFLRAVHLTPRLSLLEGEGEGDGEDQPPAADNGGPSAGEIQFNAQAAWDAVANIARANANPAATDDANATVEDTQNSSVTDASESTTTKNASAENSGNSNLPLQSAVEQSVNPAGDSRRTTASGNIEDSSGSGDRSMLDPREAETKQGEQFLESVQKGIDTTSNFLNFDADLNGLRSPVGRVLGTAGNVLTVSQDFQKATSATDLEARLMTDGTKAYAAEQVGAFVTELTLNPLIGAGAALLTPVVMDISADIVKTVDTRVSAGSQNALSWLNNNIYKLYGVPQF